MATCRVSNSAAGVGSDDLRIPGPKAFSTLDLHGPELDWVRLAEGMGVEAMSVDDTAGPEKALRLAFERHGPRLIEAVI